MTMTTTSDLLTDDMLARFDERAPVYDKENRFFDEDFEELRASGFLTAAVPTELGGSGLTLDAYSKLARRLAYHAPATAVARRVAASSSCSPPGSGTRTVTGSPASAAASRARSSASRRRPLDQRWPVIVRSRARIAPTRRAGARFPGVTRWTCTRSRPVDQRSRARAASIARRV